MPSNNPAVKRAAVRRWEKRNPDKVKLYKRINYERMSDERRARIRQYNLERGRTIRHELITFMGGKCCGCEFDDYRALQIDHVNGGGSKERATNMNRTSYHLRVRVVESPNTYQLLCANCNWIKKSEQQEHRWKTSTITED